MRLKRIGPSLVPTEVVVPLDQMPAVLAEIDEKIKQPFILEGMHSKGDKVVLLGFIPHDERSFSFNLAFALSLSVIKIAKAHGGSAYSTGAYFRREADSVLGKDKVRALASYKKQVDPGEVMNPGKVLGSGVIDALMGTAAAFEPIIRPVANAAKPPERHEDFAKGKNGIPGEVAFMAYACARCGYCVPTCEQYSGRGWESQSPRGKYAFLREVMEGKEKYGRKEVDTQLVCTTCEVCNTRCQLQLPVEHNWMQMRGKLVHDEKRGTFPPFEMMAASLRGERDIWAAKAENRADWVPEDIKPKVEDENGGYEKQADILYFAGCTASFVEKDIAEASHPPAHRLRLRRRLHGSGRGVLRHPDEGRRQVGPLRGDLRAQRGRSAASAAPSTIVTSCPACGLVWKELYANLAAERGEEYEFEVKHYSELVAEAIAEGKIELEKNPFEGRDGHVPRLVSHGPRAGQLRAAARDAQGHSGCRLRRDGAQPRRGHCAAVRC